MSTKVAYGTYAYPAPDYVGVGDIGTATYNGSSIAAHAGVVKTYVDSGITKKIAGDPKPFYFKNSAGADRVLVASLAWSGGVANTHFLIYQANADNTSPYTWGSPVYGPQTWSIGSTAITNPYKFVTKTIGGVCYIYGIDYDNKTVFRISSSEDTYTLDTAHSFTFTPPTGQESYGVDLQVIGDSVFALFISGTNLTGSNASYVKSTLVRLSTSLDSPIYKGPHGSATAPGSEVWPAENAFSIQAYGDYLYLIAVGGMQHYTTPITWNPTSRLQKIAISDLTVTDVLRAATTAEASTKPNDCFDFRALTFNNDGSQAFILTGAYDATYTMSWRLYATDMDTLASTSNISLVSSLVTTKIAKVVDHKNILAGYLWTLMYSESTESTWFTRGNDLAIYDSNGIVGSAATITMLSSLGASNSPSLNSITLYGGEVAPPTQVLKGYAAPAFVSNSEQALIERKRLFELMRKNQK
ncbi:hypothetical protein [Anaerosinus massiliensis]|uniref:hypothetical protein n=1 Tax=Massilibacillus massiliensis TaxID=1806837 RepID=UPI000DA5FD65|nr:hypothetical protein [Massilibacillus massiliensis]